MARDGDMAMWQQVGEPDARVMAASRKIQARLMETGSKLIEHSNNFAIGEGIAEVDGVSVAACVVFIDGGKKTAVLSCGI